MSPDLSSVLIRVVKHVVADLDTILASVVFGLLFIFLQGHKPSRSRGPQ